MKIAAVADVKAHFSAFLKDSKKGPVVVTKNGRPTTVLLDEDELERLFLRLKSIMRRLINEITADATQP